MSYITQPVHEVIFCVTEERPAAVADPLSTKVDLQIWWAAFSHLAPCMSSNLLSNWRLGVPETATSLLKQPLVCYGLYRFSVGDTHRNQASSICPRSGGVLPPHCLCTVCCHYTDEGHVLALCQWSDTWLKMLKDLHSAFWGHRQIKLCQDSECSMKSYVASLCCWSLRNRIRICERPRV